MFVNKEAVGKTNFTDTQEIRLQYAEVWEIIDNAPKGSVNSWEKGVNLPQ